MKNNLKELRLNAGLTQEQLAELAGTKKQYISSLETGIRDITKIRADTMERLCSALGCSSEDLFVKANFEFDDEGKLIIDNLYFDSRMPNNYVIEIDGDYFIAPMNMAYRNRPKNKTIADMLKPSMRPVAESAMELAQYNYIFLDCVPRGGFVIPLGRAITEEELSELKERFNLTEDNMTSEFETSVGAIYGKKAKKTYTAIQIKVNADEAISLESELQEKGIEARNGSPERVNIRVK